jgi:HD superfamily phosphodiesterase
MKSKIEKLKRRVKQAAKDKNFIHHRWFVKYHLEIVERMALELCDVYQKADRNLVLAMVWLHDYGKMLDFDRQHDITLSEGGKLLIEVGFDKDFSNRVVGQIKVVDSKTENDLSKASIEAKIVSSADGASHLVGPFYALWWQENCRKPFEELMKDNVKKAMKDWRKKVVLPEVREAFQGRHRDIE